MPQTTSTAVLLLAHGTPDVLGEMAEYLAKVTGGRALPKEVVEELQHRYAQIGLRDTPGERGPAADPLDADPGAHAEHALAATGTPLRVYAGMRNWHPYIADVVAQMRADGITRVIAVCLAPQNSRTSHRPLPPRADVRPRSRPRRRAHRPHLRRRVARRARPHRSLRPAPHRHLPARRSRDRRRTSPSSSPRTPSPAAPS